MTDPLNSLGRPSASELAARFAAERSGTPFLVYRDGSGSQVIVSLADLGPPITIGRAASNQVCFDWDDNISHVHAELVPLADEWVVVDDGLSRNGTYVNGERVSGRRRLRDGDVLRIGQTTIGYRSPTARKTNTSVTPELPAASSVSPAQRRVLIALARPYGATAGFATPATNQEIATELFLSIDSVKTHLRALSAKFGVQDVPQNQKRAKLVERAFATGVITQRDLLNAAPG